MLSQYVWIWTLSAVVLTWMTFYLAKKIKMKTAESVDDVAPEEERRRENGATDVIIVGSGVAGSALAYAVAKDGRRVHVIERDLREPDRMQGEVMQPGGYLMLVQLGLQDCLKEIDAQRMNGLTPYKDGKHSSNVFPLDASGRSFHHGRFVQRLRHKAASLSNVLLEEGTVNSLIEEGGVIKGVKYRNRTREEVTAFAPLTVVCDGSYSNLRHFVSDPKVDVQSYFVGFISKNCQLPNPNCLHLVMAKPALAMLYQISSTDVRCVSEVPANDMPSLANGDMSAYLDEVVAPQVPRELYDIFKKGIEGGQIKSVPTKRMAASRCDKKGVIVVGDAFNMRHPVIAAGMMVALTDVVILRDLLRQLHSLHDANKVSQVLNSYYSLRKPMATTVNTLANALHQVLFAMEDEAKEAMQEAAFEYLRRGSVYASGMMALVGGLNPRPLSLMLHLSAISLFAVARLLFPFPLLHRFKISLRVFQLAWNIVDPYLKTEGVMQMFSPTTGIAYQRCLPSS